MAVGINLSKRDLALLAVLEMTPLTVAQIRKVSAALEGEPFRDERRVRERMRALADAGLVANRPVGAAGGGLMHYYRLTVAGFRMLHPDHVEAPPRTLVSAIAPSRFQHTFATAEIIVHTLVTAYAARVRVAKFHGDGKLTLEAGEYRQQPDCHFQFEHAGKFFNVLFEVDNATEPLDSLREQSLRTKLLGYECYQDSVFHGWRGEGSRGTRPAFRVVVLTKGAERARHILWLARACARKPDRRLCYAATQDGFLAEPLAVTSPIFNDHHGDWQSLVDLQPTSKFLREPIRLSPPLAPTKIV